MGYVGVLSAQVSSIGKGNRDLKAPYRKKDYCCTYIKFSTDVHWVYFKKRHLVEMIEVLNVSQKVYMSRN